MRLIITGGHGFIGIQLAQQLLRNGTITTADGQQHAIDSLCLTDVQALGSTEGNAELLADDRVQSLVGDLADPAHLTTLMAEPPDVIVHLAAIVSGQAEAEFDLGMRVNLDATRQLLEHARRLPSPPVVVFASSVAVYGGQQLPDVLDDATVALPQTSYGAQKLMSEILISDMTRKGFINGHSLRLPTVIVRPGKPNAAASSFASGILREPLNGEAALCPVATNTALWVTSPSCVVNNLIHAISVPVQADTQTLSLPGMTVTVDDMVNALRQYAGSATVERITFEVDEHISAIVRSWPAHFDLTRAADLGFKAPESLDAVLREYSQTLA